MISLLLLVTSLGEYSWYFCFPIWRTTGWCPRGLCDSGAPYGAAAAERNLVPWQFKSQGSRETSDQRRRFPGAGVRYHTRTICSNGAAGGSTQTPAAGGSRRSGESQWECNRGGGKHDFPWKWMQTHNFFCYSFFIRCAQKITGLEVSATWSVTTWTTDFPSCQPGVKSICSSQWNAELETAHQWNAPTENHDIFTNININGHAQHREPKIKKENHHSCNIFLPNCDLQSLINQQYQVRSSSTEKHCCNFSVYCETGSKCNPILKNNLDSPLWILTKVVELRRIEDGYRRFGKRGSTLRLLLKHLRLKQTGFWNCFCTSSFKHHKRTSAILTWRQF